MKSTISKLATIILACLFGAALIATPIHAADICSDNNIPAEVKSASGCDGNAESKLPTAVENILYTVIGASGLVAVAFIVVGGVNYITSNGDAAKVEKAKKTILYACIGLAVCALAFAIVNFTIDEIIGDKKGTDPPLSNIAYYSNNINAITTKE